MINQQMLKQQSNPPISIVTVVFNGAKHVEQTIQSVLAQSYQNIEYIIIDGGSTDGTIDIIKRYDQELEYWVSEPDAGIAEAMNKGVALASGDFILFLHADDFLFDDGSIETAVSLIEPDTEIAAFNIIFRKKECELLMKPRGFNYWLNFKTGLLHQGVLCAHCLFDKIGLFDTKFSITMDYELWLRAYRHGIRPKLFSHTLSVMRDTGISSQLDWPSLSERFAEERATHYKHSRGIIDKFIYHLYWAVYPSYRKILGKHTSN